MREIINIHYIHKSWSKIRKIYKNSCMNFVLGYKIKLIYFLQISCYILSKHLLKINVMIEKDLFTLQLFSNKDDFNFNAQVSEVKL